ncbi:hsp70-binding protein 1 isoform X1 [Hydra vulgaris]|uniref:hsp70-binding protein 1 isoform X1 n=1 Tax=Hydra vulgaris TaxID=6087 RepID=UPI001F5F57CD|nr:hsp70-binding protein 1 isoform X1 [Hydra vulgaris]
MAEKSGSKALDNLLKLSLKLSDQELTEFKHTEINEERKEFLRAALESVLEDDDAKKMTLYTDLLCKASLLKTFGPNELEDLADICDEINLLLEGFDMNIVFNNLGGLNACLIFLTSSYSSIQWRVADLIANAVQNNVKCQETVLSKNGLQTLIQVLEESETDIVKVKCLYAISSLIGGNNRAECLFIDLDGVSLVSSLLKSEVQKIRLKATFLLQKITSTDAGNKLNLSSLIPLLINILKKDPCEEHEAVIGTLTNVLQSKDLSSREIFNRELPDLKVLIEQRLNSNNIEISESLYDAYKNLQLFF